MSMMDSAKFYPINDGADVACVVSYQMMSFSPIEVLQDSGFEEVRDRAHLFLLNGLMAGLLSELSDSSVLGKKDIQRLESIRDRLIILAERRSADG